MSNTPDHGPAFPVSVLEDHSSFASNGMSLRDYFAAAPMIEVELETLRQSFEKKFPGEPASIAKIRYFRADTMLEARAQWYSENRAPAPLRAIDQFNAIPPEQIGVPVVIPAQAGEEMQ